MKKNKRNATAFIVILAIIVLLVYIGTVALRVARRQAQVSEQLLAYVTLQQVICTYIDREKSWPHSWEDMETVVPDTIQGAEYNWPKNRDWYEDNFKINFSLELNAAMNYIQEGQVQEVIVFPEILSKIHIRSDSWTLESCIRAGDPVPSKNPTDEE